MPVWTKPALSDIDNIFKYIANDDEGAARSVARKIYDASKELDKYPQVGRKGTVTGTRELIIPRWPYILIYRHQERSALEILRVLHAKQKWP
ncbi:MAG: type II toxin-antitoxin system RelE/ParE family toxin [Desulfovermiculus sp.]